MLITDLQRIISLTKGIAGLKKLIRWWLIYVKIQFLKLMVECRFALWHQRQEIYFSGETETYIFTIQCVNLLPWRWFLKFVLVQAELNQKLNYFSVNTNFRFSWENADKVEAELDEK
jgi:hypothetical protein